MTKKNTLILILTGVCSMIFSSCSFSKRIEKERDVVISGAEITEPVIISEDDCADLPESVKKWLVKSGVVGSAFPTHVYVEQSLDMLLNPEKDKITPGKSSQVFTLYPPAFLWSLDTKIIKGRDMFIDGKGSMQMKLASLFYVVNEAGSKLDESTMQRYLSEIIWFPHAALLPEISWREIDDRTAEATFTFKGISCKGTFIFNEAGLPCTFTAMRYKENKEDSQRQKWYIEMFDYTEFQGITIPRQGIVAWINESGEKYTWLYLTVDDVRYE
jgi:hypothetical protein